MKTLQMGDNTGIWIPQMELWTPPPNPCQMTFNQAADLARSQTTHTTGAWYFEMTITAASDVTKVGVGIDNGVESLTMQAGQGGSICWVGSGQVNYNGVFGAYTASPFSVGDILGVDTDLTGGTIRFRVNGNAFSSNFSISAVIGGSVWALAQLKNPGDQITANFTGSFAFTPPDTAWG